jgi:hypothetical protein
MSNDKIVVDDCIVLGNAVPDIISDNRYTICTAGYSETYGLIRIYPIPPNANMNRWNIMEIPLERNPKDKRNESWKVQGSKNEWSSLSDKIKFLTKLSSKSKQIDLIDKLYEKYGVNCVQDLNRDRLSLGMIRPTISGHELVERPNYTTDVQTTLDYVSLFLTRQNYKFIPKIKYRCSDCKSKQPHNQQVIEWGFYEWMRRYPDKLEGMWDNARIDDPSYDKTFLVGNQNLYKTSFLIISIFRFKKTT